MTQQPIPLTPEDARVLVDCSLHYHFRQQKSVLPNEGGQTNSAAATDRLVRKAIGQLHAAGGPARISLRKCLASAQNNRAALQIIERYYQRLRKEWPHMIAANEMMSLKISVGGASLQLTATIDRLDKTRDGGILATLFQTGSEPLPEPAELRHNPALSIYHALVAATYPLKRPVRIRQLWLHHNREITVELSEEEYRGNLGKLREPARALARGEVRARPGLHCDTCPFKYGGCPVYVHETNPDDFDASGSGGKIPPRDWVFKI